jgi:hypothetical protein
MSDNQEEKIKRIFKDNRIKTKEILAKMYPQGKGSYYNDIKKRPLSMEFISGIKSNFGIDLVKELGSNPEDTEYLKKEVDRLRKEVIRLQAKLVEILEKK